MKKETEERLKRTPVRDILLGVIGTTALISFTLIMPNAVQALKIFEGDGRKNNRHKYYVNDALHRLYNKGLIEIVAKANGERFAKLTKEGKRALCKFEVESLLKHRPAKWDRKYRVVIFDIKENLRFLRDDLRRMLLNFGFVMLQNSVWVYPYPCEGAINLLKTNLEMDDEVLYMTVESIENDGWLRKQFKLPKK